MRITVFLVLITLLALPALAEGDGTSPAPAASCANATPAVAAADELSEEDWARLGFEVLDRSLQSGLTLDACPTTTTCTEFSGCQDTDACTTINTRASCCLKGGREICCVLGTIHITRCDCTTECSPFCDPCPDNVVRSFMCALPDF